MRRLNRPFGSPSPRSRFGDRFDIDPESVPILDGQEVGNEVVLRRDQILMFTRRAGEKGGGPREVLRS